MLYVDKTCMFCDAKPFFWLSSSAKGLLEMDGIILPPPSFFSDCRNEELLPSWPTFLFLSTVIGQTISKAELQTQLIHRLDRKREIQPLPFLPEQS